MERYFAKSFITLYDTSYKNNLSFQFFLGLFKGGIDLARYAGDYFHKIENTIGTGMAYGDVGDYNRAVYYLSKAQNLSKNRNYTDLHIISLAYLATIAASEGDYRYAKQLYMTALSEMQDDKNDAVRGFALSGLAHVEESLGDAETALGMFRESYEYEKSIDNPLAMSVDLGDIGRLLKNLNRYDEAEAAFLEALEIERRFDRPRGIALQQLRLAETAAASGRSEKACAFIGSPNKDSPPIPALDEGLTQRDWAWTQHAANIAAPGR